MDEQDSAPVPAENKALSIEGEAPDVEPESPASQEISWRRDTVGVLIAGVCFALLLAFSALIPELIWLSCLVFLIVGIWIGWESPRPWVDGAVYGLLSTVTAALVMLVSGFQMGAFTLIYPLFLALPQGIFGVWLGAQSVKLLRRD